MLVFEGGELSLENGKKREWLLANGLGGFSSSTIIGMNTRKYHGLLFAADGSPSNRFLLLSKLEEILNVGGKQFALSVNQYPGAVYPKGFEFLQRVEIDQMLNEVRYYFAAGGCRVIKRVAPSHGANAVLVSYWVESGEECELYLTPLVNCRGIHGNAKEPKLPWKEVPNGFITQTEPSLSLQADSGRFVTKPEIYWDMDYEEEGKRGYAEREDHVSPGFFAVAGKGSWGVNLVAAAGEVSLYEAKARAGSENARLSRLAKSFYERSGLRRDRFLDALLCASDSFLVKSGDGYSIIAGYHWFSEYARDAMIALPGICFAGGRFDEGKGVLERFAASCRKGKVANLFVERGEAQYNSADSSLWFLYAVRKFCESSADYGFVKERLWGTMEEIIEGYAEGSAGARVDADYLLKVEEPGNTWMDAVVDGAAVTPRVGKPVEINCLWYDGLRFMEALAKRFGKSEMEKTYGKFSREAGKSFAKFWNEERKCLFDVIEPNDASIRPNQIFAVSLQHSPLDEKRQKLVFEKVRSELLTPVGLKTLSPLDKRYAPYYRGSQRDRDFAYHQGTVWPWLLGPFSDAFKRCFPERGGEALKIVEPLRKRMLAGKWQSVPEIFEAETLEPRGCIAQAWSVAEVLRVYAEMGEEKWLAL